MDNFFYCADCGRSNLKNHTGWILHRRSCSKAILAEKEKQKEIGRSETKQPILYTNKTIINNINNNITNNNDNSKNLSYQNTIYNNCKIIKDDIDEQFNNFLDIILQGISQLKADKISPAEIHNQLLIALKEEEEKEEIAYIILPFIENKNKSLNDLEIDIEDEGKEISNPDIKKYVSHKIQSIKDTIDDAIIA